MQMKNSILLLLLLAGASVTIMAQSLRKIERINPDQVPVSIRGAFENDFGKIPEGGYWMASFIVERDGKRSIAKPLSYTYHKRNKTERVEVRYTADGKLDFYKGIKKNNSTNT